MSSAAFVLSVVGGLRGVESLLFSSCVQVVNPISGGYCSGVPPLPIPNREVKPACADGTAMQCGRVGGRRLYIDRSPGEKSPGLCRFYVAIIWLFQIIVLTLRH